MKNTDKYFEPESKINKFITPTVLLVAFLIAIFLNSCKPTKEISYVDRWREVTKTDSIYKFEKDTMFINQKGDTVFVTKIKTLVDYKYKYLNKVDTVTKVETLLKIVTEYKTKKVTNWFGWADWIILGLALFYGIYRLLNFFKVII